MTITVIVNVLADIYFDHLGEKNHPDYNFHTRRGISHPPNTIAYAKTF